MRPSSMRSPIATSTAANPARWRSAETAASTSSSAQNAYNDEIKNCGQMNRNRQLMRLSNVVERLHIKST